MKKTKLLPAEKKAATAERAPNRMIKRRKPALLLTLPEMVQAELLRRLKSFDTLKETELWLKQEHGFTTNRNSLSEYLAKHLELRSAALSPANAFLFLNIATDRLLEAGKALQRVSEPLAVELFEKGFGVLAKAAIR